MTHDIRYNRQAQRDECALIDAIILAKRFNKGSKTLKEPLRISYTVDPVTLKRIYR